ncbi:MAG: hypothetical protein ACAH21_05405 [Ramlibacter sp.]|nr:hypothetical protein [Ramlibacter sp.]
MKLRSLVSMFLPMAAILIAMACGPAQAQGRGSRDVPYNTSFGLNITNGSGGNTYSPDVIPASKRLVIEYVSVSVTAGPGDKPSLFLNDSVNGASRSYWIPLTLVDASGYEYYRASQQVKLNYDGNGIGGPGFQCLRGVNSLAPLSCFVTISGYLVDK